MAKKVEHPAVKNPPESDAKKLAPSALPPKEGLKKRDEIKKGEEKKRKKMETELAAKIMSESVVKQADVPKALQDTAGTDRFETLILACARLKGVFGDVSKIIEAFFGSIGDDGGDDLKDEDIEKAKKRVAVEFEVQGPMLSQIPLRKKIIATAESVLGSKDFRGAEVDGGNLACAQVATTILKRCGLLNKVILGCSATRAALLKNGWTAHNGPPKPGDVVIWNRTQSKSNDGDVVLGYPHIGIVVDQNLAISNSSRAKMPRMHPLGHGDNQGYWSMRGVDTYLSPPDQGTV